MAASDTIASRILAAIEARNPSERGYGLRHKDAHKEVTISDLLTDLTPYIETELAGVQPAGDLRDSVPVEDVVMLVYHTVDAAMRSEDVTAVKACLRCLVGASPVMMLAGLSISLPWADRLREERAALADAVRSVEPSRAHELLRGLVSVYMSTNHARR